MHEVEHRAAPLGLLDHCAQRLLAGVRIDGGDDAHDLEVRPDVAVAQPAADVDLELGLEVDAGVLVGVLRREDADAGPADSEGDVS